MSTQGNDSISSDATGERFIGRGGNDTIIGNGGADQLFGGSGNDVLWGDTATGAPVVLFSAQFERSLEGWRFTQTNTGTPSSAAAEITYSSGGGHSSAEYPDSSDGALQGFDTLAGSGAAYFVAPTTGLNGNLSAAIGGTLSFDIYADRTGTSVATPDNLGNVLRITGTDASGAVRTIVSNVQVSAAEETWVSNSINLVNGSFTGVSAADFQAIMSSVTDFRISGEYYAGGANDSTMLDNVVLTAPAGTAVTTGNDVLDGESGNDILHGGDGRDTLIGGIGNDTISGDAGNDVIYGEGSTKIITARSYFDNADEGWATSQSAAGAQTSAAYLEAGSASGSGGIQFTDTSAVTTGYFHSNEDFEGNQSAVYGGSLSFRQYLDLNGAALDLLTGPQLEIVGAAGTLTFRGLLDQTSASAAPSYNPYALVDGQWTTVEIPITAGNWMIGGSVATEAQIKAILASVSDIRIKADYTTLSGDSSRLDNVELHANPNYSASDPHAGTMSTSDVIDGGDGNDLVYAGAGNDTVTDTGDGNDTIHGQGGDDSLSGGIGEDSISGGEGRDHVLGGADNDILTGGAGDDTIDGGIGNDVIHGDTDFGGQFTLGTGQAYMYKTNFVQGQSYVQNSEHHYDSFLVTGGPIGAVFIDNDPLADGDGVSGGINGIEEITNDQVQRIVINGVSYSFFMEQVCVYVDGAQTTTMTPGQYATMDELVAALAGRPYYIFADIDIDYNGDGLGSPGWEWEDGSVKILLSSSTGLPPPPNTDLKTMLTLSGEPIPYNTPEGADLINAGDGDDIAHGDGGNDTIYGGVGNDTLYGGSGNDNIAGDAGNDRIDGGAGVDSLSGGVGNDTITVGGGDTATGGDDRDVFIIDPTHFADGNVITIDGGTGSTAAGDVDDFDSIVLGPGLSIVDGSYSRTRDADGNSFSGSFLVRNDATNDIYTVNFTEIEAPPICFCRGTEIQTIGGKVNIEDLQVGDQVLTMDHGYRPIRWIGGRSVPLSFLERTPDRFLPIRIAAGALGKNSPEKALYVSPQHRILVRSKIAKNMFDAEDVLIPAKKLLPLKGVTQVTEIANLEYYHILFDDHEIVYANGAAAETLFLGPEAMTAVPRESYEEILALFPELGKPDFQPSGARMFLNGKQTRKLLERHTKNSKNVFELF